jgi:bis(5'-nucleosyl)-tetraphosphatase (symmetrical)
MATYAIGDVQGCFRTLCKLVDRIQFDPATDRLWFVGDLVNRGPRSLEVLRWVRALGDAAVTVLGNHDLNLLAVDAGVRKPKARDTLDEILSADDRAEILDWLALRPLVHREGDDVLVHAGIPPAWSVAQAEAVAREVEDGLRTQRQVTLEALFGGETPRTWSAAHSAGDRLRAIAGGLTRMRACETGGALDWEFKGSPGQMPRGLRPWFEAPARPQRIFFGHWAALGLHLGVRVVGLDSGCVWGGPLTAYRLEDAEVFSEPNAE